MSRGIERKFANSWKIDDAIETYGITHWGKEYFGINAAGHVTVHPTKRADRAIDLKELVDQLQARGIQLPILLRFTDIQLEAEPGRIAADVRNELDAARR